MERLEDLAAYVYLLTNFADQPVRIAVAQDRVLLQAAGGAGGTADNPPRLRIVFDPRSCGELLSVTAPLWLFKVLENGLDRLRAELRAWANGGHAAPTRPPLPPVDFTVTLRNLRFKNGRLDPRATAAELARDPRIPLDLRLVITVHNGCLREAAELCEQNAESAFQHGNAVSAYRRVAMRYVEPWELAVTSSGKLKCMPASFLVLVPVAKLLSTTNFLDSMQILIAEYVKDTVDDESYLNHVTQFVEQSKRNMAEMGPRIFSALISTFCDSHYRCEKLLQLSIRLCGQLVTDQLLDNWPCPPDQPFTRLHAIFLATAAHPMIVDKLIRLLINSQFNIGHDSLLIVAQRNDYAMSRLVQEMIGEDQWFGRLWSILSENGYELFHSLCYCGAWRTVSVLARNLPPEKLTDLIGCREYGCLLAACKKGRFLVVTSLTNEIASAAEWEHFFTYNNFEAFYHSSKGGHKAVVEWFGQLCTKWGMPGVFQEASYFVVKLLEVEAKSLLSTMEAIMLEHPSDNDDHSAVSDDRVTSGH